MPPRSPREMLPLHRAASSSAGSGATARGNAHEQRRRRGRTSRPPPPPRSERHRRAAALTAATHAQTHPEPIRGSGVASRVAWPSAQMSSQMSSQMAIPTEEDLEAARYLDAVLQHIFGDMAYDSINEIADAAAERSSSPELPLFGYGSPPAEAAVQSPLRQTYLPTSVPTSMEAPTLDGYSSATLSHRLGPHGLPVAPPRRLKPTPAEAVRGRSTRQFV